MKIAIISDTHDNAPNLEKALEWMNKNKIEQIIHCGDLCASETLAETLAPNFKGKIHMVFGNADDTDLITLVAEQFKHVKHYGDVGEIKIENPPSPKGYGVTKKIAFAHFPWEAKKLAESGKYNIVFYGHTHKPWDEQIGNTRMLNPGTLAGLFQKATFAVWNTETGEFRLQILERL
ncbi:MAG: YfcE family phosphodiesterase [Patescibacteria group bacterium]